MGENTEPETSVDDNSIEEDETKDCRDRMTNPKAIAKYKEHCNSEKKIKWYKDDGREKISFVLTTYSMNKGTYDQDHPKTKDQVWCSNVKAQIKETPYFISLNINGLPVLIVENINSLLSLMDIGDSSPDQLLNIIAKLQEGTQEGDHPHHQATSPNRTTTTLLNNNHAKQGWAASSLAASKPLGCGNNYQPR